jgi:ubiquinone biosynthesis protein
MTPNQWEMLFGEASLTSVMPVEHAKFARPVREALCQFLAGLTDAQQAKVLAGQARLPAEASFSERLGVLARCSPVLHKLGQVLARDQRLPEELRIQLRELESLEATVPQESIQRLVSLEIGNLDGLGIRLLPAIAEASVAVVIPYEHRDSNPDTPQGVFKVLKPGIEQQLEHELGLLRKIGEHLDNRCEELQIPALDYEEAFEQARVKLQDEIQLENEQRHLVQAKKFFQDEPRVHIPTVLEHCTPRVTSMERLYGHKVTECYPGDVAAKRKLATWIAEALIATPVFSRQENPLFHGDPHAGNLFLTHEGRLGILDWSLCGRLGIPERTAIVQVLLAAIALDAQRMAEVMTGLADGQRVDSAALLRTANHWIRRIRRGQFPGLGWLMGLMDEAVQTARVRVSTDMALFRKSILTLEGVIAEVGEGQGQLDRTLTLQFLRSFASDLPLRWFNSPTSRDYSTRVSNLDLTHLLLGYPTTVASFFAGNAFDILEAITCQEKTDSASKNVAAGTV